MVTFMAAILAEMFYYEITFRYDSSKNSELNTSFS